MELARKNFADSRNIDVREGSEFPRTFSEYVAGEPFKEPSYLSENQNRDPMQIGGRP